MLDRLAPALRRAQGRGDARAPRIAALSKLHDDGPMTMRDLALHLGVSPQAVTGLVDTLEAEGVVMRERHPTDRRKTVIRLSDHARDAVKAARTERAQALAALFNDVPKADRAAFARVVEALLDRLG
ncbi:MAG: MarR family transcriptional regulator [Pseudomonadota bacterium]